MLEAMLQQLLERPPNPNTSNDNVHAPNNRDGVEGVALDRPGGGRLPRVARHLQFEDFSDEDSDVDLAGYQGNRLTLVNPRTSVLRHGQQQLFCLGIVLLKRNKILVLDEANASIDSATYAILQRIIRQEFSGCSVITVAHRVPTVIDSDMVMVLSYGKLLEYDEPSKLMETNSSFSKLVAEYWSSCMGNSYQILSNIE
ncbi:hypothetical protein LWI28_017691 [Acer negundo]|uniref:ABC transporter domain-containing protein n=1 Tax=Acer negundo TaxID=4023 RepID=A0AAD5IFU4_ACENE|nr:hypothetical protein LWI28_017691 [Acer negundo]